jgi:hypothetical protein
LSCAGGALLAFKNADLNTGVHDVTAEHDRCVEARAVPEIELVREVEPAMGTPDASSCFEVPNVLRPYER